jgi:hypothetical protein
MKALQIDRLLDFVKRKFDGLTDKRATNRQYELGDTLQSGLAMFSLKDSSLLVFNKRFTSRLENLQRIYKIKECPSDSQMRAIVDEVLPLQIERVKRAVIQEVKKSGMLKEFEYFPGWKLLLVDGVKHFSSKKVSCDQCQQCRHEDGSVTYSHSMLAGVIAHPEKKQVLALCEEPIVYQDGATKNDCELNASGRLLSKIQTRHLVERFIVVEDALFANGPHILALQEKGHHFIIRVKTGSRAGSVLEQYEHLKTGAGSTTHDQDKQRDRLFRRYDIQKPEEAAPQIQEIISTEGSLIRLWHAVNNLFLNQAHPDIKVNLLHYEERSVENGQVLKSFDWITDIVLTRYNVKKVTKAGRCRWKIENETFNTLKNQGYHFEHNYGHGNKHLCTNLALLMMLAFLIDQIQQLCNDLFNQALQSAQGKKYLWEDIRSFFRTLPFNSMEMIYKAIIYGVKVEFLVIGQDSS